MRRMERMLLYMRMLLILKGLVTEIAIPSLSLSLRTMLLLLLWATFLPMSLSLLIFQIRLRTNYFFPCLGSGAYTTSGEGEGDLPVLGSAPPPDPWMQGAYRTGTKSCRGIYYAKCFSPFGMSAEGKKGVRKNILIENEKIEKKY